MRWCRFGTDFFVCDCEKRKMYWMYIEFFGKKQAGKDVPKMCRRINQRFLSITLSAPGQSASQRALAPQGSGDPVVVTGKPSSPASVLPPWVFFTFRSTM